MGNTSTTFQAKPQQVPRNWIVVDLQGKTLGRAASKIAMILRGKTKPEFTPHVDAGEFVVAINADKLQVTGKKADTKMYYRHSLFPGGLRTFTFNQLMAHSPTDVLVHAVKGMLPKNRLGRQLLKKLKVYAAAEHPHQAQQPKQLEI